MDVSALEDLQRWQAAGGLWRVVGQRSGRTLVELCRCDGGEVVGRLTSDDPQFLDYLADNEPT